MRKVRYSVAASVDGYIADQRGGFDWIIMDPAIDFPAFFETIDTVLMGRRTFEVALQQGPEAAMPGMRKFVFSRTLRADDHPGVTIVTEDAASTVAALRAEDGKDIWLMGGGVLFKSLLEAGLVDTVEVGVVPVLLGQGVPLLPGGDTATRLDLMKTETFPSGIILLKYAVRRAAGH